MNYRTDFEQCFEYIETHLKEKITTQSIAEYMGYSYYHFCRVFRIYKGMTLSEYVIKRRLESALDEIREGKKILDIALEYQFETASGFTKAFRNQFHMTPMMFRKTMNAVGMIKDLSELPVDPKYPYPVTSQIKTMKSFFVSGLCHTVDLDSSDYKKQMTAFWSQYDGFQIEERLYEEFDPEIHAEIGITIQNATCQSKVDYLFGVITREDQNLKMNPWVTLKIPSGTYAVFTTPPIDMTKDDTALSKRVEETWHYIFDEWFPNSGFLYDESRFDFEYYDERCHYRANSVMDIYIPVKE